MSGFEQRDRPGHAGMPAAVAGRDRREFAEFYVRTTIGTKVLPE
jgi:hypothetical protein